MFLLVRTAVAEVRVLLKYALEQGLNMLLIDGCGLSRSVQTGNDTSSDCCPWTTQRRSIAGLETCNTNHYN